MSPYVAHARQKRTPRRGASMHSPRAHLPLKRCACVRFAWTECRRLDSSSKTPASCIVCIVLSSGELRRHGAGGRVPRPAPGMIACLGNKPPISLSAHGPTSPGCKPLKILPVPDFDRSTLAVALLAATFSRLPAVVRSLNYGSPSKYRLQCQI